jgi:hypothetical protein
MIQKRVNLLEVKEEYQVSATNRFAALEKGRYCRALSSIGERSDILAKQDCASFQASAAKYMRTVLLWVIVQQLMVEST